MRGAPESEPAVFVGKHDRQLDDKGRLAIPAEFVKRLGDPESNRELYVTPGRGGCIWLVTKEHWNAKFEDLAQQWSSSIPDEFYHFCQLRPVDKAGRILIDEKARELAGMPAPTPGAEPVPVVVAGSGRYMQVWFRDRYDSRATSARAFTEAVRP